MHIVTGGAGFIGSNLVAALCARGEEVVVVDRLRQGVKWRNLAKHPIAGIVAPDDLPGFLAKAPPVKAAPAPKIREEAKKEEHGPDTMVINYEQGKALSTPNPEKKEENDAVKVQMGAETKYKLQGRWFTLGLRGNFISNQGLGENHVNVELEGYAVYPIALAGPTDNFKLMMELGYAIGYDQLTGFKGGLKYGWTLALCTNGGEVDKTPELRLCWLNNVTGTIMPEMNMWLEASTALELQKKVSEDFRIRGGARADGAPGSFVHFHRHETHCTQLQLGLRNKALEHRPVCQQERRSPPPASLRQRRILDQLQRPLSYPERERRVLAGHRAGQPQEEDRPTSAPDAPQRQRLLPAGFAAPAVRDGNRRVPVVVPFHEPLEPEVDERRRLHEQLTGRHAVWIHGGSRRPDRALRTSEGRRKKDR